MPRNREVSQIGYSHIRVLGKIYQVEGYREDIKKKGKGKIKVVNKDYIIIRQIYLLDNSSWVEFDGDPFYSKTDREWRVWHEHEFVMGSLGECMDADRITENEAA